MHVSKIIIRDLPPLINQVEFDCDERANLFIGPNASGKTTILRQLNSKLSTLRISNTVNIFIDGEISNDYLFLSLPSLCIPAARINLEREPDFEEPTDLLTINRSNRLRQLRQKETLTSEEESELNTLRRQVNEDLLSKGGPLEAQRQRYADLIQRFLLSRQSDLTQEGGAVWLRCIDRGTEPTKVARYAQQYTQGWIDYFQNRTDKQPSDFLWVAFRSKLGSRSNHICWYCEQQCYSDAESGRRAPTVDHFRPRSHFPHLTYGRSDRSGCRVANPGWVYLDLFDVI